MSLLKKKKSARYYDPTIGRFLQRDPIGYYDSMNVFAYVGNDPVNFVDPLGLFSGGGMRVPPILEPGLYPEGGIADLQGRLGSLQKRRARLLELLKHISEKPHGVIEFINETQSIVNEVNKINEQIQDIVNTLESLGACQ